MNESVSEESIKSEEEMQQSNYTDGGKKLEGDKQMAKSKKKETQRNYYITDIAAVSDDEQDEISTKVKPYKDTNYIDSLREEADSAVYNKELMEHIRKTQLREQRRHEQISGMGVDFNHQLDDIENRYSKMSFRQGGVNIKYTHDSEVIDELQDLKTEKLLPSTEDPKLWKVGCQPGKERDSILELITTFQWRKDVSKRLHIKSAFTSDLCRGYIYIEAYKREEVLDAVSLVSTLYRWKMTPVPIMEMPETLEPAKQMFDIKPGSWARVTRGVHKGDIAFVLGILDDGFKLEIKLVPRIDFGRIKRLLSNKNDSNSTDKGSNVAMTKSSVEKRKLDRLTTKGKVPPARLFEEAEVKRHLEQVCDYEEIDLLFKHVRGATYFMNQKFIDGYRILKASAHSLELNVTPTEGQRNKFNLGASGNGEKGEEFTSHSLSPATKDSFRLEDNVKVVSGDLANLTGKIISIKGERIFIEPHHKDLNEPLGFAPSELTKYFTAGAHVKIIKGRHKNVTGFVTKVDEEERKLFVFLDIGNKIITVSAMNAIESSEISSGKNQLGNFSLLDFVQLDIDSCGMIVQVMQSNLKVLTEKGMIQTLELKDIKGKRFNKNVYGLDKNSNQMTIGDVVKVSDSSSPFNNKTGTIENIYKNGIFLHSKEIKENCGIFVVQSKNLLVTGSRRQPRTKKTGFPNDKGSALLSLSRGKRDRWEGKYVIITRGIFKGQRGLVKAVPNMEKFLVELLTENKIVTVNKEDAEESQDGSLTLSDPSLNVKTPVLGANTPATGYYNTPKMTPSYATPSGFAGGKTPLYGSKTPLYGNKTPFYDGMSKTPVYQQQNTPLYGTEKYSEYDRLNSYSTFEQDRGDTTAGSEYGHKRRGQANWQERGRGGRGRGSWKKNHGDFEDDKNWAEGVEKDENSENGYTPSYGRQTPINTTPGRASCGTPRGTPKSNFGGYSYDQMTPVWGENVQKRTPYRNDGIYQEEPFANDNRKRASYNDGYANSDDFSYKSDKGNFSNNYGQKSSKRKKFENNHFRNKFGQSEQVSVPVEPPEQDPFYGL